jgi:hypothetical protein
MEIESTSGADQRETNLRLIDEKFKQLQFTKRWERIQKLIATFPTEIDADKPGKRSYQKIYFNIRSFIKPKYYTDFDIKADVGFSMVGGLETYLRSKIPLTDDPNKLKDQLFKALKPFMLVTCKIMRVESSGVKLQLRRVHIEDILLDCLEEVTVTVSSNRIIYYY